MTESLLFEFETKPELLIRIGGGLNTDEYFEAVKGVTAIIASNYILPEQSVSSGSIAQGLAEWHKDIQGHCSFIYKCLTEDTEGPRLSREEANSDNHLRTLQSIRRGVRYAMKSNYKSAQKVSTNKLKVMPSILDIFES